MSLKSSSEAGFLSKLFFWWLNDLLFLGYKRDLTSDDLEDQLTTRDSSLRLSSKLFSSWDKGVEKNRPSLFRAIRKQFGLDYVILGLLPFIEECGIRTMQALLLGVLISKLESKTPPYLEASLIILCSIINVLTTHWFYFSVQRIGMRVRVACSCLIYRKNLVDRFTLMVEDSGRQIHAFGRESGRQIHADKIISLAACIIVLKCLRQLRSPEGKLLNLLTSDVQRFDQSSVFLHYLWIGPLNVIIIFTILYKYYGEASFIGLIFLILFTLLQAILGITFSKLRSMTAACTDLRMDFMNNMLKKMKQIKMLGLEEFYSDKVKILRKNEVSFIRKAAYLKAINLTFFYSSVKIIFFLTMWWYGKIETETVFVTLSLFHNVRSLMTNYFPNGVLQLAEATVAINRIQSFLLEPDQEHYSIKEAEEKPFVKLVNIPLKCRKGKLNLEMRKGDIVSFVGSIGTGKTTLIKGILGEEHLDDGKFLISGKIAYVPQTPWIYPGSMVDNIILNSPFDLIWYEKVVGACALKKYGHISLETLSGGMRARIALARAAYSKADIYLFDDPFAALDGSTKSFIIDELIHKLLDGKIRIICGGDCKLGRVICLDEVQNTLSRRHSIILNDMGSSVAIKKKTEVEDEELKSGSVRWRTYVKYFTSGCGFFSFILLIIVNIACQISFSGSDYYTKIWDNDDAENSIRIYGLMVLAIFVTSFIRTALFFWICLNSSVKIHDQIFAKVSKAHQEFLLNYGKILNRFGKDMGLMDESLPPTFFSSFSVLLHVLGTIIVISIVLPVLLAPATVLIIVFYFLRRFYIRTGRAVKRIEALARSPLYTLISSTASGLSTIRCYNAEDKFLKEFSNRLDQHSCSWYINLAASRWFGIWLDWISVIYTSSVVLSFLVSSHTGSDVGLAISSVLFLSGTFQLGARQSADVENQMVSVERILEYSNVLMEDFDSGDSSTKVSPPIQFTNVSVTYNNNPVISNVNFIINPGEKIALLGKTGCGKTTLLKALYRLADYTGSVTFAGIESKLIKLRKLRSSLSIIPQDPYLFKGTIRENLDPLRELTDDDIYRVFNNFASLFQGIYSHVEEDGRNLSQGQRQILSLIRVILKGNEILVMDEPTANLDAKAQELINKTLEEFCSHCTVITVAHRLSTIAHYDRAFRIQDGCLEETSVPRFLESSNNNLENEINSTDDK